MNVDTNNESNAAKNIECDMPLCPHILSYGMPNLKPITSASGSMLQMMAAVIIVTFTLFLNSFETAKAKKPCVNMVGIGDG